MSQRKQTNNGLMEMLGFRGMNQRQDADKIDDKSSPLLINISLDKPDTWAKRKGSTILGTTQAGTGVQGGIEYSAYAGTKAIRIIRNRNLDIYNGSTWATSISNMVTASTTSIQSVLFNNKVYHISTLDNLVYETGTGVATTVGSGGSEIKAQNLAVAQNTLFVGNVTQVANVAVSQQDRIYYSFFDSTNNLPSDQLWTNATGHNTLPTSLRFFTVLKPNTALFTYGVTGLVYAFTEDACYQFDLRNAQNAYGVQRVFNIGCCGPRAVTECNGWMIWMDMSARLWSWGGAGPPIPLSWPIEDDANGEAIINQIDKTQLSTVAAGTDRNKFFFDVGNVTTFNETITNAMIKGLVTQGLNNVLFSVDSYPFSANIFINATLSSVKSLLFGASGVNDIYQMNSETYADNAVAISAKAKTKFYFEDFATNAPDDIYIKYRPQSATPNYLVVKYATDLNTSYTTISDPVNTITSGGVLNMYDASSSTKRDAVGLVSLPQEARGRTLSIEVGNSQLNQGFEVSGLAFSAEMEELDVIIKAS